VDREMHLAAATFTSRDPTNSSLWISIIRWLGTTTIRELAIDAAVQTTLA